MRNFSIIVKDSLKNMSKFRSWKPIAAALAKDIFRPQNNRENTEFCLNRAAKWLTGQQTEAGGFATQYSLLYGRTPEFPETTGYIIPTLVELHRKTGEEKYLESARKAGDWLLSIQSSDGWFPGNYDKNPYLFDTSQIIFGLLALYRELKEEKFLEAARKAGDWIVRQQSPEGFWQKYAYNGIPHTYYSRVSWALLELWKTINDADKTLKSTQIDADGNPINADKTPIPTPINADVISENQRSDQRESALNTNDKRVDDFLYEEESYKIRGACFEIWNRFGGAFKEKIVDRALSLELQKRGLKVEDQKRIEIKYNDNKIGYYVPDKIVNDIILLEIKSKEYITEDDIKQFWYYLKGSNYKLGFLINFGPRKLTIKRVAYDKARNADWQKNKLAETNLSENQRSNQRESALKYLNAAEKQLDWVLARQQENGFFKNCSFFSDETPVLHVIAYTVEGLLESGLILLNADKTPISTQIDADNISVNQRTNQRESALRYIRAARETADKLLELNQLHSPLFGYYDADWRPKSRSRCLTGLAQTSNIFFRLYEITGGIKYLKEAKKINRYLKTKQILAGPRQICGALAGSYPVWGKYMRFGFPNWAAKFWIDALLLEEKHKQDHLVLAVFPADPLIAYVKKGEMRKNYWNPQNIFSEIHLFDFCDYPYSEEDKNKLRFMTGDAKMSIHQIPFAGLRRLIHQYKIKKQLLKLAKKINPDIIRSHGLFLEGYFGKFMAEKTGIPLLVSLHGDYDRDIRGQTFRRKKYLKYLFYLAWKYFAELKILRNAQQIIAVYQFAVDYALKNGAASGKVNLIYNKVSSQIFFPDSQITKNPKFTVIHVGRQIPEKNQKTLIEAIKDLDCELILVGQGPEKENLRRLAENLNISQKVKFVEKIDNKKMGMLYNQCHAYATANLYGGIEIPVIEAMACGLPIIRSKNLDEPEPELLGRDGCIFVENTPDGFKQGIQKLMADKDLYGRMSQKSLEIYESVKGEKMEEKEKEVYLSLI